MKTNFKLRILSVFMAISLLIGMAPITAKAKLKVSNLVHYLNEKKEQVPMEGVYVSFKDYQKDKYGGPTNDKGWSVHSYHTLSKGVVFAVYVEDHKDRVKNPRINIKYKERTLFKKLTEEEVRTTYLPDESDEKAGIYYFRYDGSQKFFDLQPFYMNDQKEVMIYIDFDEKIKFVKTSYSYDIKN